MALENITTKHLADIIANDGLAVQTVMSPTRKQSRRRAQKDYYALFGEDAVKALLNTRLARRDEERQRQELKNYGELKIELDRNLAVWRKCASKLQQSMSDFSRFLDKETSLAMSELIDQIELEIISNNLPF